MNWNRLSLSWKIFAATLLVTTLVIVFVTLLVGLNMRAGFSLYLANAELDRFQPIIQQLAKTHSNEKPGWPELTADRENWRDFTRKNIPRPKRPPRPPQRQLDLQTPAGNVQRRRPPPDPMRLGGRLVLLDSNEVPLIGHRINSEIIAKRPIETVDSSGVKTTVGWLALNAAPRGINTGDRLFLQSQYWTLIYTALMALLLSAIGSYLLSRQFLKPINKIKHAGEALAFGNYSIRLEKDRDDELGALIQQFNELAHNLENREQAERRWVSDTSHELKTPLSVLLAQVEALQDGIHKPSKSTFNELHRSITRLNSLVSDLNTLAVAREGKLDPVLRVENFSDIVSTVIEASSPEIGKSGLNLLAELPQHVPVNCDRLRVEQLIDNLLSNARRYTTSPGEIHVVVKQTRKLTYLIIEDSPPSPHPDELAKLFDRFYRAEKSRSREHGGSGLGLSICREIVSAHGGAITLKISRLGGLKITVTLPSWNKSNE